MSWISNSCWNKGIKYQSLQLFSGGSTTLCVCVHVDGVEWERREGEMGKEGRRQRVGTSDKMLIIDFVTVQFSHSVVSDSLRPHGLQHARLPCPSPIPRACSDSCPLSWWCHPTISSSVVPFFSHLQSFPALGSFPMSQFFTSGGQSIRVSASASVLPVNIQDWFPLGWTGLISLQSKGLSRVFSSPTVQRHQFFGAQLSLWSNSHIHTWLLEKP